MDSYSGLGFLFLIIGIGALVVIESPIVAIVLIVAGLGLVASAWANTRRGGPSPRA